MNNNNDDNNNNNNYNNKNNNALFTTQSEYLLMDMEQKQVVSCVQKCILTLKNLNS